MKLKHILLAVAAIFAFNLQAMAQGTLSSKKVLVTYFSATGTTADVANMIAGATGGDLFEIAPAQKYSAADLNWRNKNSRSSLENADPKARPALAATKANIADYDVVFIGYPIWWDVAPRVVNTFIESHDLKGKTIIPFATSGGSGVNNSVRALQKEYPDLQFAKGTLLNYVSENEVRQWVEGL